MGELALRLFFYGAIAFVPNSSSGPEQMTAYLLNVAHGDCVHVPLLHFVLSPGSSCPGPNGPSISCLDVPDDLKLTNHCCELEVNNKNICFCPLDAVQLVLDPPTIRRERFVSQKPSGPRPTSEGQEDDLSWLLRIKNIDQGAARIQPGEDLEKNGLISAAISFGWENAQACHLDQEPDGDKHEVRTFEFVDKNGKVGVDHQQALAEEVMFDVRLPVRPVKLVLKDSAGASVEVINLGCDSGRCPDLAVGNPLISVGGQCDETVTGDHFGIFYGLSRKTSLSLVPRVKDAKFVSKRKVLCKDDPVIDLLGNLRSRKTKEDNGNLITQLLVNDGVGSRIICPMAYFEP